MPVFGQVAGRSRDMLISIIQVDGKKERMTMFKLH